MTLTPPLNYFGSKTSIAPEIVSLMPAHRAYVEPYAGALSVLLAKSRSPFETVNDLDGDLMCFWRVLRDRCEELERACALSPHSRQEAMLARDLSPDLDDVERARRVWVKLSQGRGGSLRPTGWRYHEQSRGRSASMPGTLAGYVGRFGEVADRLARVSLESRPALDIIGGYGRDPEALLYVDPPYLGSTRSARHYRHEMTGEDEHAELAEALHKVKATVLLSGYASDLYDCELYADWFRHEIRSWTGQANDRGSGHRTEVVWSNRRLAKDEGLWDA